MSDRESADRAPQPLARRVRSAPRELPHRASLERAFGPLPPIRAHVGESAALRPLGATAAADEDVVAFASASPDRGTAAHEVAHVLQARRPPGGDAEAEAEGAETRVTAGRAAPPIRAGARGLHRKIDDTLDHVTAEEFVFETDNLPELLTDDLMASGVVPQLPYGRYIARPDVFARAVILGIRSDSYNIPLDMSPPPRFGPTLQDYLAPESLVEIVDRARRLDTGVSSADDAPWFATVNLTTGPVNDVYRAAVGWEITNALIRRLRDSMARVIPRLAAVHERESRDWNRGGGLGQGAILSHPMDLIVNYALFGAAGDVQMDWDALLAAIVSDPAACSLLDRQSEDYELHAVSLHFPVAGGLYHWVEASRTDATAEEVAQELFGRTWQAYRLIPMAPFWGFHLRDIAKFRPEKRDELYALARETPPPNAAVLNQAKLDEGQRIKEAQEGQFQDAFAIAQLMQIETFPILGYSTEDVDPVTELAARPIYFEQEARTRAKARAQDTALHDAADVYERLKDAVQVLAQVEKNFSSLGADPRCARRFREVLARRRDEAAAGRITDADPWYALADQQARAISRIATGMAEIVVDALLFGGVRTDDSGDGLVPDVTKLAPATRAPLLEAIGAFDSAVAALEFPEIAEPRIDEAARLVRQLKVGILEASLHQATPVIEAVYATPDDRHDDTVPYDPDDELARTNALHAQLAQLRVLYESDPAQAAQRLPAVQEQVGDVTFELAIVANLETLDAVWDALDGEKDFWSSAPDDELADYYEGLNRGFYEQFRTDVYDLYTNPQASPADKQQARANFKKIFDSDGFAKYGEGAKQHIVDMEKHKRWTKMIVGIAIAFVAFALGQWALGAMLVADVPLAIAVLGADVVAVGTGATLNKLILNVDETAGGLITGFIANAFMYGFIGKALVAARGAGVVAELAEATAKASLAARAGEFVVQSIFATAIGTVQANVAKLIDSGRLLNTEETEEMLVQQVVGLVGMKVAERLQAAGKAVKPFRGLDPRIDVAGLLAERASLLELAESLQQAPDASRAQELLVREHAYLEREREVRDQLIELAKAHPEKFSAAALERLRALPDGDPNAEELRTAQAVAGIREVGPGLYRADPRALDAILALHERAQERVISVETDPVTGMRTLTLQSPEGVPIVIEEQLASAGQRTPRAVSVEEALRFEEWLEAPDTLSDEARAELRTYYARDPEGAIQAAQERHGYAGSSIAGGGDALVTEAAAPIAGVPPAEHAFAEYEYQRERVPATEGEAPLTRADFDAMYEAGFAWDPVDGRWYRTAEPMRAGSTGSIPAGGIGGTTHFVGVVHSEAVGLQVMRMLASGDANALRVAGVEPPPGFDPTTTEWGLGRRPDGTYVLVRGGAGQVNWSALPDVEPIAHSHPFRDPITGAPRALTGKDGSGLIDPANLEGTATHADLVYLLASESDLRFVALGGKTHRVHTPYVLYPDGRIGNPQPGMTGETIDIVIVSADLHGQFAPGSDYTYFHGEIQLMAGDVPIGPPRDVYSVFHQLLGDVHTFEEPPQIPLPPDHPLATAAAPGATKAGEVPPDLLPVPTAHALSILGVTDLTPALALDAAALGDLGVVAAEGVSGRVAGLDAWLRNLSKNGDLARSDLRWARAALEADPTATAHFDESGRFVALDVQGPIPAPGRGYNDQVVPGLYEGATAKTPPPGTRVHAKPNHPAGATSAEKRGLPPSVTVTVTAGKGAQGKFTNSYDPATRTLTLDVHRAHQDARSLATSPGVVGETTPASVWASLASMNRFGIPKGGLSQIVLSNVQNPETIVAIHQARERGLSGQALLGVLNDTPLVRNARTIARQSGHDVVGIRLDAPDQTATLAEVQNHWTEGGDLNDKARSTASFDELLANARLTKSTTVEIGYNIELQLAPMSTP